MRNHVMRLFFIPLQHTTSIVIKKKAVIINSNWTPLVLAFFNQLFRYCGLKLHIKECSIFNRE